jgi:DNA-binding response OmpR family regulator
LSNPLAITGIFMLGASAGSLVSYIRCRGAVRKYQKTIEGAFADIDRSERINTNYRMKALVVSGNRQTIDIFAYLFREVGIEAANCDSKSRAIDRVTSEKFDALVLDFDNLSGCSEIVENVRGIRPNREIPLFAIASENQAKATALALSSNFVIERPLVPQQIKSLLRTVYGRMLRSSQAYFRLNIELSVSMARASGPLLNGRTLNVSQNGMALTSPVSLKTGEMLHLVFAIPHTDVVVSAEGTVIWDDGHGKSGIRFKCSSASAEARYFEWLHDHFFMRPNAQYLDTEIQRNPAYASCE